MGNTHQPRMFAKNHAAETDPDQKEGNIQLNQKTKNTSCKQKPSTRTNPEIQRPKRRQYLTKPENKKHFMQAETINKNKSRNSKITTRRQHLKNSSGCISIFNYISR
jgi:hypothetical protein